MEPYVTLLRQAVRAEITLAEFASLFSDRFKEESRKFDDKIFDVLNGVALDADEYVPAVSPVLPEMRRQFPAFVIDDAEFMERVKNAIAMLEG